MALSEWGLLALYGHNKILVNSSPKATKKKIGYGHLKIQMSNPGPSWPSCFLLLLLLLLLNQRTDSPEER